MSSPTTGPLIARSVALLSRGTRAAIFTPSFSTELIIKTAELAWLELGNLRTREVGEVLEQAVRRMAQHRAPWRALHSYIQVRGWSPPAVSRPAWCGSRPRR